MLGLQLCFPHAVGGVFMQHVQMDIPLSDAGTPDDAGEDLDLMAVLSPALRDPAVQLFSFCGRYVRENIARVSLSLLPASGLHPSAP